MAELRLETDWPSKGLLAAELRPETDKMVAGDRGGQILTGDRLADKRVASDGWITAGDWFSNEMVAGDSGGQIATGEWWLKKWLLNF